MITLVYSSDIPHRNNVFLISFFCSHWGSGRLMDINASDNLSKDSIQGNNSSWSDFIFQIKVLIDCVCDAFYIFLYEIFKFTFWCSSNVIMMCLIIFCQALVRTKLPRTPGVQPTPKLFQARTRTIRTTSGARTILWNGSPPTSLTTLVAASIAVNTVEQIFRNVYFRLRLFQIHA